MDIEQGSLRYDTATEEQLRWLLSRWVGRGGDLAKVEIERLYFADVKYQAQGITHCWRTRLGEETMEDSKMTTRFAAFKLDALELLDRLADKLAPHNRLAADSLRSQAHDLIDKTKV